MRNTEEESWRETIAFRDAAIADGWSHKPTYECEPEESSCSLDKGEFHMSILTRKNEDPKIRWTYQTMVAIWGPDGLAIEPPATYDFAAIKAGLRVCGYCHAHDVHTSRVGFAGRCCNTCLPEVRKKVETPGWYN